MANENDDVAKPAPVRPVSDKPPATPAPAAPRAADPAEEQKRVLAAKHPDILPKPRPAPNSPEDIAARKEKLKLTQRAMRGADTRVERKKAAESKAAAPANLPTAPKMPAPPAPAAEAKKVSPEAALRARHSAVTALHKNAISVQQTLRSQGKHAEAAALDKHISAHASELEGIKKKLDDMHAAKIGGAKSVLKFIPNPATGTVHAHAEGDAAGDAGMYRIKKTADGSFEVHRRPSKWERSPGRKRTEVKGADGKMHARVVPAAKQVDFTPVSELPKFKSLEEAQKAVQTHHDRKMMSVTGERKPGIVHTEKHSHSAVTEINQARQRGAKRAPTSVAGMRFVPASERGSSIQGHGGLSAEARAKIAESNKRLPVSPIDSPEFSKEAGNLRYRSPSSGAVRTSPTAETKPEDISSAHSRPWRTPTRGALPGYSDVRYDKEGNKRIVPAGKPHATDEDKYNATWRGRQKETLAIPVPPTEFGGDTTRFAERSRENRKQRILTHKSVCNCCHCDSLNKGEVAMSKFEDIFKSDTCVCPDCGGEIRKGGVAKKIGNEMAPHRGAASGQVDHPRGGMKGGVLREHVQPKNPTVEGPKGKKGKKAKKSETPDLNKALFPCVERVALVTYAGLEGDAALAKSVETNLVPGAGTDSGLFVPPSRNLAMEQESAKLNKAFPPAKDDDSSSESESASDDGSDDGSDDSSAESESSES